MASGNSWQCPYCQHYAIANDHIFSQDDVYIKQYKDGNTRFYLSQWICPNPKCKELTLTAMLWSVNYDAGPKPVRMITSWRLRPNSSAKPLPDYIPKSLVDDYYEACAIRDLSSKASATMSRRCLQGMIRDRWQIVKSRLIDEIDDLKTIPQVDPLTWKAIDAVRKTGNIGAHMEKDVNLVIDVTPAEAQKLIGLLEYLFDDWYISRHQREQDMLAIIGVAEAKDAAKQKGNK